MLPLSDAMHEQGFAIWQRERAERAPMYPIYESESGFRYLVGVLRTQQEVRVSSWSQLMPHAEDLARLVWERPPDHLRALHATPWRALPLSYRRGCTARLAVLLAELDVAHFREALDEVARDDPPLTA